MTGDIYIFFFGNGLIDDIIVIGWTDSDLKISRALVQSVHVGCFSRNSKFSHKALSLNVNLILDEATGCKQV